jgi:hypothetical protein
MWVTAYQSTRRNTAEYSDLNFAGEARKRHGYGKKTEVSALPCLYSIAASDSQRLLDERTWRMRNIKTHFHTLIIIPSAFI